jgi:small-conductance mechanosensitive channel
VLLGAAGVFSVAIGFASQTSVSNLISGLFVLVENTFEVGDVIRVGSTTGEVLSIDWLSVKLRTFDNLFVRIPNETMIKSEVTNITKFPIRRIDLKFTVDYKTDLTCLENVLMSVADQYAKSLEEPEPLFIIEKLSETGICIQFSFWVKKENLSQANNNMISRIVKAFHENGIEFFATAQHFISSGVIKSV